MVACNPRDREAAHRAEVHGIATHKIGDVTCRKCLAAIGKFNRRLRVHEVDIAEREQNEE